MLSRLILFLLVVSCKNQSSSMGDSTEPNLVDNKGIPVKYKSYFKVSDRRVFKFTNDDIELLELNRIDSIQFVDLLQSDELLEYNNESYSHYFYSFQSPNDKYQAITLVINREYDFTLYYLIYSKEGKLISKFEIAGEGGDGLFLNKTYGRFINDTICTKTIVSLEFATDTSKVPFRVDSVESRIYFNKSGKLLYQ